MRRSNFSIRTSIILCLLLSIIPIDILFIVFSNHSIRSNYDKILSSYRLNVDTAAKDFESLFSSIENDLVNLYLNSMEVRYMRGTSDPESLYHYGYTLINNVSYAVNNDIGISFVYAKGSFQFSIGEYATERMVYSDFFDALGREEAFDTSGWYLSSLDDHRFLVRILGNGDIYLGKAILINDNLIGTTIAPPDGSDIILFRRRRKAHH